MATGFTGLAVLVYLANVQEWGAPLLDSNRWAVLVMGLAGLGACITGGRTDDGPSALRNVLGGVGGGSFVLVVIGLITDAQWALTALVVVIVALWLVTTLRHAASSGTAQPTA